MSKVVITGWSRTPFGRFLGSLSSVPATELGALVIKGALEKAGVAPEMVDYVLLGMVVQAGTGQIPSRQSTIKAGLSPEVPSDTINKVCASSLRAVNLAAMMIHSGEAEIIVAGGMENMSAAPYLVEKGREGYRMGNGLLVDAMITDGLWCPVYDVHMGVHGGRVPAEHGVTREEADLWSLRSHQLAIRAMEKGYFEDEIIPVEVVQKKGVKIFDKDELPRVDTSYEKLARLHPVFEKEGFITAGNAPPISDGASAVVVMSEEKANELGVEILAELISSGVASADPTQISTVPFHAARKALKKAGLGKEDLDLIEVNEAFAAVARTCIRLGDWDEEKVNINGGAVAIGHPIGASGTRILMTLLASLRRRGGGYGLATICSGAAQGEATIVRVPG